MSGRMAWGIKDRVLTGLLSIRIMPLSRVLAHGASNAISQLGSVVNFTWVYTVTSWYPQNMMIALMDNH